jgi:endonuclease/exonuclease/phosphatase family metal-dependent hydrolase
MGLTRPRPTLASANAPTIRILSYNVAFGYGASDFAAQLAEMNRYTPDIVFLEEIGPDEKLVSQLKERYAEVIAADQFVVATRFHIVSTTVPDTLMVRGHAHHARFLRLEVDCPLGRIVFYVVHPISPREALWRVVWGGRRGLLTGKSFGPANADAFYENAELRERQASAFGDAAQRETDPVIIAGDTNLPDLSWILGRYLSGFQDGFLKAGRGFGYTFPTGRYGPWMRIDRIFATTALRFVHFEVGTSHASDHLCVVADVQRALL